MGWLVLLCAVLVALSVPALAADDAPAAPPPPAPPALEPPAGAAPPVGEAPLPGAADEEDEAEEEEADAEDGDDEDGGDEDGDDEDGDDEDGDDEDGEEEGDEDDEEEEDAEEVEVIEPPIFVGDKRLHLATDPQRHRYWPWHGSVRARYRLRTTSEDSDNDLFGNLLLKYRDENMTGLSGSLHGRLTADLDYFGNTRGFYVWDGITDTWKNRVNPKLYHAYVNYRPGHGPIEYARLGRQYVDAGDYFLFDGLLITSNPDCAPKDLRITAFGGIPTHLYEGSISGDAMGGISIDGTPWRGANARFDYVHFEDDNEFYGAVSNDLLTFTLRQRLSATTNAHAIYKHLNGEPHRLNAAINHYNPRSNIVATGYFRTLLNYQTESVYDIDPYVAVEQTYEPYFDAHGALSKGFSDDRYAVEVGATVRQLWDQAGEGRYNREWVRYYATISSQDWLARDLALSLTGEGWNTSGGGLDDNVYTITFDLDYRPSDCWRFKFGTDYAAYRTDFYFDDENVNSYRFFAGARWSPGETWTYDLLMSYEWDDFDEYFGLRAAINLDF